MQDSTPEDPPNASIPQLDPSAKLTLEIQKLRHEIEQQQRQSSLLVEKLNLENKKLQLDVDRAIAQDRVMERKLSLDVRELARSPWLRPGTIVPILATVGTILFAQYQGVFDVAQRKLELTNLALKNDRADLERQNARLDDRRKVLDLEVQKLDNDRAALVGTINSLKNEKSELQARVKSAQTQVAEIGRRLAEARQVAAKAEEQVEVSYPAFRDTLFLELATEAVETCLGNLAITTLYTNERDVAMPLTVRPRVDPPIWLTRSIRSCFDSVVRSEARLPMLREPDLAAFLRKLHRAADRLDFIRNEALDVYADPSKPIKNNWLRRSRTAVDAPLAPILLAPGGKPLREAEALPVDEPRRTSWIEWRRRFNVERSFRSHVRRIEAKTILDEEEDGEAAR